METHGGVLTRVAVGAVVLAASVSTGCGLGKFNIDGHSQKTVEPVFVDDFERADGTALSDSPDWEQEPN